MLYATFAGLKPLYSGGPTELPSMNLPSRMAVASLYDIVDSVEYLFIASFSASI